MTSVCDVPPNAPKSHVLLPLISVVIAAQASDTFSAVCKDCDGNCTGCSFGSRVVPKCVLLSEVNITNAKSDGGTTTLEELLIDGGFWRATSNSTEVLACYNKEACKGGVSGHPDYCSEGYEGPCESVPSA